MSLMPAPPVNVQAPERQERGRPRTRSVSVEAPASAAKANLYAAPNHAYRGKVLLLVTALSVYLGFRIKPYGYIDAESGMGYVLGLVGSACMILLILYPIRKNVRLLRNFGSVKFWFNVHLALGIAGPLAVLYHSNFTLGSLHCMFVLGATILVFLSGFTGLFIHTRIHSGFFGSCMKLTDLRNAPLRNNEGLRLLLRYTPKLAGRLERLEQYSLRKPAGPMHGLVRVIFLGIWARWTRMVMLAGLPRAVRVLAAREKWPSSKKRAMKREIKQNLVTYSRTVLKIAEFAFYERLFSIWHFFHYPLYLLLIVLGVVHVVIVHMY